VGRTFDEIPDEFAGWLETQPVFFVATAPADPEARVNVSPRGLDTFRVLAKDRVAWLDLTGSGVETVAHLKDGGTAGGRITLMFCAFWGPPKVVRLYGRGRVREPDDEGYAQLRPLLPDLPGERAVIDVSVDRVGSSCGFGVPLMDFVGAREELLDSAKRKGEAGMARYRARKNTESIDGLPGIGSAPMP
jgi:Pyridoxamine 5'-phosphate oxidase